LTISLLHFFATRLSVSLLIPGWELKKGLKNGASNRELPRHTGRLFRGRIFAVGFALVAGSFASPWGLSETSRSGGAKLMGRDIDVPGVPARTLFARLGPFGI
jgi:hypothetical protein